MSKIIVGNWKMNGSAALVRELVPKLASHAARIQSQDTIILCPPAPYLSATAKAMEGSFLALGAQDVSPHKEGAYTGDISTSMLVETGCRYVIVGHCERRQHHAETNALVRAKAEAAIAAGLIPILCVGETLPQRESGNALEIVEQQLQESLPINHQPSTINPLFIAYEPVWAIGTGRSASLADIEQMHAHIRASVGANAKILYGGSVKGENGREILAVSGVDGVLVGGASLQVDSFIRLLG